MRTLFVIAVLLTAAISGATAAGASEVQFSVDGMVRRAIVVNANPSASPRPAVIVLHGGAGNAAMQRSRTRFDKVASAHDFMVAYAEGSEFRPGMHAWNTGYLMRRQVQDVDDIAYFDTLIAKLISDHRADPKRIFMTGGSNGAMMTLIYAVKRPEKLAAIAPVVGAMFSFDQSPARPVPILLINGAKDDEVPIEGGMSRNPMVSRNQQAPYKPLSETVQFWVRANKSSPQPHVVAEGSLTTTTYPAQSGGAVTVSIVDADGGHGWPGTDARGGGQAPIQAFNGADRVWQFFKDQVRAD